MTRHTRTFAAITAALAGLLGLAGCSSPAARPAAQNGHTVVPIDPNRPGDALFSQGLDAYRKAFSEQVAATKARLAGDAATADAQDSLAVTDYGSARALFDQLDADPTLCPAPSIRCDDAAYLGGRCSYEIGFIQGILGSLPSPLASLTDAQASLTDAEARLDAMLKAWPASAFVDAADYFDGRARFELKRRFSVGAWADAEPFFERAYAANPAGTFADNAFFYDGRTEFEAGYELVNAAGALNTVLAPGAADYSPARAWFDQAIGVLTSFPGKFPTSPYVDNAAYYLGRAWFEKPTPGTTPDPERVGDLDTAITVLGSVVATTASPFVPGAHYWRGRAHYERAAFDATAAATTTELGVALADFHAVPATSPWQPHALEWAVKSWIREGVGAAANACAEYAGMAAAYPLPNVYTTNAKAALDAFTTANALAACT